MKEDQNPQSKQAKEIQENKAIFYKGLGDEFYAGDNAWKFIADNTGFDLKRLLTVIADNKIKPEG